MNDEALNNLQQTISAIRTPFIPSLHVFKDVPKDFLPWESGLSPSALYNCSLACRKRMRLKTPETKWMSIKRWVSVTPGKIVLPAGVFLSIKRKEEFVPTPDPHFDKKEFVLMMFPFGNVWSQQAPDVPITEEWLWSSPGPGSGSKITILESLMRRDAARPVDGYFASCHKYMIENPDQIGIHLKRKKKDSPNDTDPG